VSAVYPWYEAAPGPDLEQGDIFRALDIPTVRYSNTGASDRLYDDEPEVDIETFDAIVLSQSCDLQKPGFDRVLLCPIWPLGEAVELHPHLGSRKGKNDLRDGRVVAFHLLNQCDLAGFERDFSIVQFERVLDVPKALLQMVAASGQRLRLLPPYREHMAQAFARFFMRVGLPVDIPPF